MKIIMVNKAGTHTYGPHCLFYVPGDCEPGHDSSETVFNTLKELRAYAVEKGDCNKTEARNIFNRKWAQNLPYFD